MLREVRLAAISVSLFSSVGVPLLLCCLILFQEIRVPSIDIYHRIWNPLMEDKIELQTPLAFARKHLESSAIYRLMLIYSLLLLDLTLLLYSSER